MLNPSTKCLLEEIKDILTKDYAWKSEHIEKTKILKRVMQQLEAENGVLPLQSE
jgi:hypothetical protein